MIIIFNLPIGAPFLPLRLHPVGLCIFLLCSPLIILAILESFHYPQGDHILCNWYKTLFFFTGLLPEKISLFYRAALFHNCSFFSKWKCYFSCYLYIYVIFLKSVLPSISRVLMVKVIFFSHSQTCFSYFCSCYSLRRQPCRWLKGCLKTAVIPTGWSSVPAGVYRSVIEAAAMYWNTGH